MISYNSFKGQSLSSVCIHICNNNIELFLEQRIILAFIKHLMVLILFGLSCILFIFIIYTSIWFGFVIIILKTNDLTYLLLHKHLHLNSGLCLLRLNGDFFMKLLMQFILCCLMLWNAYVSLSLRTYIYIVISEHSSFIRRWNGMKVIWNYKSLLKRSFTLGDSRRIESFLYSWSIYTYSMYVHSILGNTIYWHLTLAKLEFFSKYIRFWFKLATLDIDIFIIRH